MGTSLGNTNLIVSLPGNEFHFLYNSVQNPQQGLQGPE